MYKICYIQLPGSDDVMHDDVLLTAACFLVRVQLKELITVAPVASWRVFAHMHTITGWVTFIHV